MRETVEVSIPVDAAAAALLTDAGKRAAVGRIVSKMLRTSVNSGSQTAAGPRSLSPADLYAGYLAMAADEEREAEALEWIEGLIGDVVIEPPQHDR